ncbi:MAG TPA: spermidine synthase [Verrucomicrobiae bacterium]|nr:spermidine synthase [Verrucomicrobiae bacterium]
MIPWVLIDTAPMPGGKDLKLYRHDADFAIRSGNVEVMNSRMHGSEEVLSDMACAQIARIEEPRLLIGGLGMGFTLRAALNRLPPKARVTVAELVPAVVKWNRGVLSELAGHALKDKRVSVVVEDVSKLIRDGKNGYHAIILDIDNGPGSVWRDENNALYSERGLEAAFLALQPRGVLAVWSAGPDRGFTRALNRAGFDVKEVPVRARIDGKGGGHHHLWLARRFTAAPPLINPKRR